MRHHRRERRRLGGFVAFSEMLADLTPKPLFDKTSSWEANLNRRERAPLIALPCGSNPRAARRRANLTQTGAAEQLRSKLTFVSEIERGPRRVDVLEIALISRALDTNLFQLFGEVTRSVGAKVKTQKPKRPKTGYVYCLPELPRLRGASEWI
jgi:transcriptional regulator with XRE-family HTH domain